VFVVCDISLAAWLTIRDAADTYEAENVGRNWYVPNESTQVIYISVIIMYHASGNT
jgi:hypothetical protein